MKREKEFLLVKVVTISIKNSRQFVQKGTETQEEVKYTLKHTYTYVHTHQRKKSCST